MALDLSKLVDSLRPGTAQEDLDADSDFVSKLATQSRTLIDSLSKQLPGISFPMLTSAIAQRLPVNLSFDSLLDELKKVSDDPLSYLLSSVNLMDSAKKADFIKGVAPLLSKAGVNVDSFMKGGVENASST